MIDKAKTTVALGIFLLGFGAVIGLSGPPLVAQSPAAETPDAAVIARGEATFSSSCGFCHGSKATGTEQAPNLLRSPLVTQDHDGEVLAPFLKDGRPSLGMPAFPTLQPTQVSEIAAFLHNQLRTTRRNRLPESALLVGNAKAGEAYFNGAGKCSSCHSLTGDLAGIGGRLQPLALTTSFLTPPAQPIKVSATLPTGKVVSGAVDYVDEFTLSMNDTSGLYHTWPRKYLKAVDIVDPLAAHKKQLERYNDKDIHDLLAYLVTIK